MLCYSEKAFGLVVVRESYDNYLWKLLKYMPKMVVLSNYIGAPENFFLVKQVKRMGIKVVLLISERNVRNLDETSNSWGWNAKKESIVDLFLVWSERSKILFEKIIPESSDISIKVSAATGFDRYFMFNYMERDTFLAKYRRNERKIIGIAAWGFN